MATLVAGGALALSAGVLAASPAAEAATQSGSTSAGSAHYVNPAAIQDPVLRGEVAQIVQWEQTHKQAVPTYVSMSAVSHHADAPNAAGDPCTSFSGRGNIYTGVAHIDVAWVQMTTDFCYTGPAVGPPTTADRVTSHNSTIQIGVTEPGNATGWSYVQNISGINFKCYVTAGGTNACSGNEESDQVEFQECLLKIGCDGTAYPSVTDLENFRGQTGVEAGNVTYE